MLRCNAPERIYVPPPIALVSAVVVRAAKELLRGQVEHHVTYDVVLFRVEACKKGWLVLRVDYVVFLYLYLWRSWSTQDSPPLGRQE